MFRKYRKYHMKFALLTLLCLQAVSNGAITFTGRAGTGFGATDVPVGALVLFLVDDGNDGFLGDNTFSGLLTAINDDPGLSGVNASTNLGSRFGGDMVFGRAVVNTASEIPFTLTSFDQTFMTAPFDTAGTGRNFSIVWLKDNTSGTTGAASGAYGIIRGSDWVIPASDGTYSTSTTFTLPTVFARVTNTTGTLANHAFGTATSVFTIVPEPSAALLAALGALGLLRRRRN